MGTCNECAVAGVAVYACGGAGAGAVGGGAAKEHDDGGCEWDAAAGRWGGATCVVMGWGLGEELGSKGNEGGARFVTLLRHIEKERALLISFARAGVHITRKNHVYT